MIFRVKPIKPTPLRSEPFRREIEAGLKRAGTKDRRLLEQTTQHWAKKPKWITDIGFAKGDAVIMSYIQDADARQIWDWINEGTDPHWIYPVRANMLRFNSQFRSQSAPNRLQTTKGHSGPPVAYAKAVHHPGIKARRWTIIVIQQRYKDFREEMNIATKKALKAGGWG